MKSLEEQILELQQIKPFNSRGWMTLTSHRKWETAQNKIKKLQEKLSKVSSKNEENLGF